MEMLELYKKYLIDYDKTLIECLEIMDKYYIKVLLVVEKNKFYSLVSIGDIQRAIISGASLNERIKPYLRKNVLVADETEPLEVIRQRMIDFRMELCPIIDSHGFIIRIILWKDLDIDDGKMNTPQINLPVVIMAGGKGTRLRPLTNIIPKPMVPFGNKSMIEAIIERFMQNGCEEYFVSGNYMFDMLQVHLESLDLPVSIDLQRELVPTGSGGSLALFREKIASTFIVTNCDIIVDDEYYKFLEYHRGNNNDVTIITSLKSYTIPYGTIDSAEDGILIDFHEKPKLNYQINTGLYLLEPGVFDYVPEESFIHITEIISRVKEGGGRIGVFPVSEKSWRDIGEWNLFLNQSLLKEKS